MRPELTFAAAENAPSRSRATMSNASGAKRPRASTRPVASSPAGSRPAQTASPQSGRSSARICRRGGDDRAAAPRVRPDGGGRPAEDRREPAHDRLGPACRSGVAYASAPAGGRAAGGGREVAGERLRVHHRRRSAAASGLPDRWFGRLVQDSGLPAVRLHDLRHGAASLAHCAGADLKTAQEQLGHTSIVLTADTYTNVLHEQHVKAAATAPLVLAAALPGPGHPAAETPCRRAAENSSTAVGKPTETPSEQAFQYEGQASARAPTYAPQRSRAHSRSAIRPGDAWCTA